MLTKNTATIKSVSPTVVDWSVDILIRQLDQMTRLLTDEMYYWSDRFTEPGSSNNVTKFVNAKDQFLHFKSFAYMDNWDAAIVQLDFAKIKNSVQVLTFSTFQKREDIVNLYEKIMQSTLLWLDPQ